MVQRSHRRLSVGKKVCHSKVTHFIDQTICTDFLPARFCLAITGQTADISQTNVHVGIWTTTKAVILSCVQTKSWDWLLRRFQKMCCWKCFWNVHACSTHFLQMSASCTTKKEHKGLTCTCLWSLISTNHRVPRSNIGFSRLRHWTEMLPRSFFHAWDSVSLWEECRSSEMSAGCQSKRERSEG